MTVAMESDRAELSSLATTVDDIAQRVERLATEVARRGEEAAAYDLYEVERSLRVAQRRLARLMRGA